MNLSCFIAFLCAASGFWGVK